MKGKLLMISKWFGVYCVVFITFGIIYFSIYRYDSGNFSIPNNPFNQIKIELSYKVDVLVEKAMFIQSQLSGLGVELDSMDVIIPYTSKKIIQINKDQLDAVLAQPDFVETNLPAIREINTARSMYDELLVNCAELSLDLEKYAAYQNKETILDFFYFSVITLGTVGYGDILPNKTLTRLLVTLEILIGLGVTIFAVPSVLAAHD